LGGQSHDSADLPMEQIQYPLYRRPF